MFRNSLTKRVFVFVYLTFELRYLSLKVIHVDRIRKKYSQNLPGDENEQIESYEEKVAKDDLTNKSMKTDKAMEFNSNKEISDNVGIDSEIAWLKTLPG
jgi:hypothetical protein